jgi:hypothetical protein
LLAPTARDAKTPSRPRAAKQHGRVGHIHRDRLTSHHTEKHPKRFHERRVTLKISKMHGEPIPAPPGWKMQVFEVVPALSIATRLDTSSEYGTLDVDVIVDLEDWEAAWAPPVPLGRLYVSFPMDDGDEVDPKVRQLAVFIASLVTSGRRVLVHCTEGLNRSGVVVARALMAMGLTASDAIDLVRRQRGPSVDGFPALGNDAFVDWLHREGHQASP